MQLRQHGQKHVQAYPATRHLVQRRHGRPGSARPGSGGSVSQSTADFSNNHGFATKDLPSMPASLHGLYKQKDRYICPRDNHGHCRNKGQPTIHPEGSRPDERGREQQQRPTRSDGQAAPEARRRLIDGSTTPVTTWRTSRAATTYG